MPDRMNYTPDSFQSKRGVLKSAGVQEISMIDLLEFNSVSQIDLLEFNSVSQIDLLEFNSVNQIDLPGLNQAYLINQLETKLVIHLRIRIQKYHTELKVSNMMLIFITKAYKLMKNP
jgi:hypothetical protein